MTPALSPRDTRKLLLQLGDTSLILSQRLCERCGLAPSLEEDVALSNIALDLLGQARLWLAEAGRRSDPAQSEDALAYWRAPSEFLNLRLVEQPSPDFAWTVVAQFLFSSWSCLILRELGRSRDEAVSAIAGKSARETRYHLEYAHDWVTCLGRATPESHSRMRRALSAAWPHTGELFSLDVEAALPEFDPGALRAEWADFVGGTLAASGLAAPDEPGASCDGPNGIHGEALVALLAELQSLPRAHPGASW